MGNDLLPEYIIRSLEASLPPIFTRREIPRLTGGVLCVGTLANLGKNGPPYVRTQRHAVYERDSFMAWFRSYIAKFALNPTS
jgi:hypothetical protein